MTVAGFPFESFAPLAAWPFLFHAFTTRGERDTKAPDAEARVAAQFGYRQFARADQPHGPAVARVTDSEPGVTGAIDLGAVDALVTNVAGLLLVVRCADCAPVYLVDPRRQAIGLVHSGRKGTLANVVGRTVAALASHFGTDPADLLAYIGPSIGPCHYDLDLWNPIAAQLRAAGAGRIELPRTCTACHLDRYYSYRAEKGQTGRHFALLALR